MPRLGLLKNPSPIGARPVTGPPPARRWRRRRRNCKRGWTSWRCCPTTLERQRQELEFCSALGAVLQAVKGSRRRKRARPMPAHESYGSSWVLPRSSFRSPMGSPAITRSAANSSWRMRLDEDLLRLSRQRNDSAGLVLGHFSSGRNLMYARQVCVMPDRIWKRGLRFMIRSPTARSSIRPGFDPHVSLHGYLGDRPFLSRLSGPGIGTEQRGDR